MGFRAHVHKTWEAIGCVNLDFDDGGFEADDGAGVDFGKHRTSLCKPEKKSKLLWQLGDWEQTEQQSGAIRLFVARAAAVSPHFVLTGRKGGWEANVCRLDRMPLAIELETIVQSVGD